ncbi:unnamed protein product [Phytophthora fragariaefolia]|uniref:Unnamed protein product n=1 Tax=Phytophthora fragariaefolia TaxID=1490495 RepID=A0A9W6XL70_9STRA|nr:unnamed protein product [Phytophthora fragariaefolia]
MKEQREVAARATVSTPSPPRVDSLKLHVNSYVGREGESLLRWLVEVDTAITARRIVDPLSKVAFAMSCLGGRASTCGSHCGGFRSDSIAWCVQRTILYALAACISSSCSSYKQRRGETGPSPSQAYTQAKAARTASDPDTGSGQRSLPVRNLTLSEGLARVRGATTQHQEATAAQEEPASSRKRSASQSPRRKARDSFRGLFDSSSDDEKE